MKEPRRRGAQDPANRGPEPAGDTRREAVLGRGGPGGEIFCAGFATGKKIEEDNLNL